MLKSIRLIGLKATAFNLALCLLADVVRVALWVAGEKKLSAELLAEQRKMWN